MKSIFNTLAVAASFITIANGFVTPPNKLPIQSRIQTERYFFNFGKKQPEPEPEPETKKEDTVVEDYYEDDIVEKIFNFFFGKKEAEPLGMKIGNDNTCCCNVLQSLFL